LLQFITRARHVVALAFGFGLAGGGFLRLALGALTGVEGCVARSSARAFCWATEFRLCRFTAISRASRPSVQTDARRRSRRLWTAFLASDLSLGQQVSRLCERVCGVAMRAGEAGKFNRIARFGQIGRYPARAAW
jgi:hypothetical protein